MIDLDVWEKSLGQSIDAQDKLIGNSYKANLASVTNLFPPKENMKGILRKCNFHSSVLEMAFMEFS